MSSAPSRAPRASLESLESRVVLSVLAPTGLDATLVEPRGVRVTWDDVTGETGYLVERRIDGTDEPWTVVGDPAADVTTFAQDGLTPGRTYLYRVRARDASSRSEPSNVDSVTVPVVLGVPEAPRLNANYALADGVVRLEWTNVANETSYQLERRVDGSTAPFAVITTRPADTNTYVDERVEAGNTYIYRVRASNDAGNSAYSNNVAVVVPGAGVPAAPRELVAESVQGLFVRLRWANVEGENGFRIERRLDGSGSGDWVEIGNTAANVLTFADERVESGRRYAYRVRAFNGAGTSPYSNVAFVTVQAEPGVPGTPRELNAELTDAGKVRVTWQDVENETGYKVERRVDGTADWLQIGTTAQNVVNFVDERVEAGKTYIYRVRAFNDVGHSSYSNTDAVRIPGGEPQVPAAPRLEVEVIGPRAARLHWTDVANETGYLIERRVDGSDQPFAEIRRVNAGVTTIVDDGLTPGRTYIYRVRAFNAAGNSAYSNTGAARIPLEGLPTAPRELRATAVSPTRVDLRWADSTGETAYRIERRLDGTDAWVKIGNARQDATTFSDTTAQPGRTYLYRVRADNAIGSSPWSNVASARTPGEGEIPAAPRELDASLTDGGRVRLRWLDVSGEQGYRVERRLDGSDDWVQIGTTGENVTTFIDERVERGRAYVYRVRAFNAAGNSPYSNTDAVRIPEATVPAAPRLEAARVALRAVRLAWTNVANEAGYRIYRRVDGSEDGYALIRTVGANVTSLTDEGLEVGKTYLYKVLAFNAAGNSPFSNVRSVAITETFRPAAPRELVARAVSPTRVELSWADVRGDTGYRIERRVDGSDTWVKLGYSGPSVTRFSDTTAQPGKTYFYRVRAGGVGAVSEWSNVASATTPTAPAGATVFSATRIRPLDLESA